jgi:hypothetical protein
VARRPRATSVASVTWRDGAHLTGTPIWCDARRRRDVCFVSSAERVGRIGHGQLIGTPLTLGLLGATGAGHLAVPPHRRFTLGTLRLELIPTGRGFGAAGLHVDLAGRTTLYAGPVRAPEAEVRACDAVVVAAPFGELAFPPLADVVAQVSAWASAQLAAGKKPVLVVDSVIDGLEIASRLAPLAITGSRALREAAARMEGLAPVPLLRGPSREPVVTIRVDDTDRAKPVPDQVTALVSGRALEGHAGHAAGFAWANASGRTHLLGWIESTGAREVYVTGAAAESIVAALGPRARLLGPPHQMTLFPREAAR